MFTLFLEQPCPSHKYSSVSGYDFLYEIFATELYNYPTVSNRHGIDTEQKMKEVSGGMIKMKNIVVEFFYWQDDSLANKSTYLDSEAGHDWMIVITKGAMEILLELLNGKAGVNVQFFR